MSFCVPRFVLPFIFLLFITIVFLAVEVVDGILLGTLKRILSLSVDSTVITTRGQWVFSAHSTSCLCFYKYMN